MKKQTERDVTYMFVFVVLALALFAHIKHEKNTFVVNGTTYTYVGMMEFNDEGKKIYLPIFKGSK